MLFWQPSPKGVEGAYMATMNETPDALNEFIVRRTDEHWEKTKAPYLLSKISTDLIPYGVNYRNIIGEGTTLKQYVSGFCARNWADRQSQGWQKV
jgi:hypothetical protein